MICGTVSAPNAVAPMMVHPVWYNLSIEFSRMVKRVVFTFSNMLRQSFSTCHRLLAMRCSVSMNALTGISKNAPISGASIHSFVDSTAYSGWDMMYPECKLNEWSSFLTLLVPGISQAWSCQRLLKLGCPRFFNKGNGISDIFWCIFHHAEFHAGSVEFQQAGDT